MGAKHSQQRCVHGYSSDSQQVQNTVGGMDYAYTVNVTESQYGSWTKISLADSTAPTDTIQEDQGAPGGETEGTICSQFLTQPPSEQQDSIIREVAEKLIDVGPDVSTHSKQDHSTSFPQAKPQTKVQTPQPKAAMHYSLSLTPQSEEGIKKEAIAGALSEHFESLVEQVEPEVVANKLYGIAVLDSGEVERTSEGEEPARLLMQLLKKKLWKNPGWFVDVCKIFRACGVKAISQVIDDVQKKCPSEEVSILSSGSPSAVPSKAAVLRRQTSCHDTFTKLEESFKQSGLQGATDYVEQLNSEQPVLGLIHESCLGGVDVSTLDLLLSVLAEKNHDIDSKSECGQTPLHIACASLRPPAESAALEVNVEQRLKIEHLLSHKASNWIKDKDGNTPLHLAVLRADNETVTTLLNSGRRCLNVVNKRGNSALHLACKLGLVDIVKTLCSFNADVSLQNKKMRTALHLACMHENNHVACELASHDPSTLDAFENHRMTPLHITAKRGNDQLTLSLLKLKNCSPYKMDEDDRTPLHYACTSGSLVVAAALLEKNSDKVFVDMQDRYGDTALHIASRHGYTEVVKELLSHRASKDIVNQETKTPMDIAIEGEHNTIATKMMRKRGWNQRRKSLRRVRKMRRTLTQASLASSFYQSEMSEILENPSDESGDDETIGIACVPKVTKLVIREN